MLRLNFPLNSATQVNFSLSCPVLSATGRSPSRWMLQFGSWEHWVLLIVEVKWWLFVFIQTLNLWMQKLPCEKDRVIIRVMLALRIDTNLLFHCAVLVDVAIAFMCNLSCIYESRQFKTKNQLRRDWVSFLFFQRSSEKYYPICVLQMRLFFSSCYHQI